MVSCICSSCTGPIDSASTGRIPVVGLCRGAAGLLAPGGSAAGLVAALPSDWLLVLDEESARLPVLLDILPVLHALAVPVLFPLWIACWALVSAATMSIGCFWGWGLLPLRFLVTCLLHGAAGPAA